MKTIIAGTRYASIKDTMDAIDECPWEISEVVSGEARGPDTHGADWGERVKIPVKRFPADWESLGRRAGLIRNSQMAEYADALLAVWDGHSRGTRDMIAKARKKGLRVHVVRIKKGHV